MGVRLAMIAAFALAGTGSVRAGELIEVATAKELAAACRAAAPGGFTIRLKPGVYEISDTLRLRKASHTNISGSGWNTVIKKLGAGDALVFEDCHFSTVRDLLIQGQPAASGSGLVFRDCSSCTVDFCRIDGFAVSGVRFEGNAKAPMSSNTVSRCHFIGNRQEQLYSLNNNDFYILQNQFGTHSATPKAGCVLDHSSAGTYSLNYHWGNVNALRLGPGAHYNRIENNRFEESRETGVVIGSESGGDTCSFNIISGNTIHTNSQSKSGAFPAVAAWNASHTTFSGNQILSWSSNIYTHSSNLVLGSGCAYWVVTGNIMRHNSGKSIVSDASSGHIVKDNIGE